MKPVSNPFLIPTSYARASFLRYSATEYEYWGTKVMTRLLCVSGQIYAEAIGLLWAGEFEFMFPTYLEDSRRFAKRVGKGPRTMIERIKVDLGVSLERVGREREGNGGMRKVGELWGLREGWLTGLRRAIVEVRFTGKTEGKQERKEIMGAFVKVLGV